MDDQTVEDLLTTLAKGEVIDLKQWPPLQVRIIERLELIVIDTFPSPSSNTADHAVPPTESSHMSWSSSSPAPPPTPTKPAVSSQQSLTSTDSGDKENAPPTPPVNNPIGAFPVHIQSLISSIKSTLDTHFTKHPPHTIQRLAELILKPREHYRNLPAYLHAVDRVVHVTSGAHIFPLPPAIPHPSAGIISTTNSTSLIDPLSITWHSPSSVTQPNGFGNDDSLGGALLTPISWLTKAKPASSISGTNSPHTVVTESTEMIDGPNGMGGIETVTVSLNGVSSTSEAQLRAEGGVTQGELLRQEQRAGVVPVTQLAGHPEDDDDDIPHARGPEEIGAEDIGNQRLGVGIDVAAAMGREPVETEESESEPATPKREAEEELGATAKRAKEEGEGEEEETDAESKTEKAEEVAKPAEPAETDKPMKDDDPPT